MSKKPYANRLDCLEIAFERNPQFENALAYAGIPAPPTEVELAEMWEQDLLYVPGVEEPTPSKKTTNVFVPLSDFTIGQWRFLRDETPWKGNSSHYRFNFKVVRTDTEIHCDTDEFGYLYFETHQLSRNNHIYLKLSNRLLYDEDTLWKCIHDFQAEFNLTFVYVSKADIAVDGTIDTSQFIYNHMKRDMDIEWVVNGKVVTDRNETIKKLFFLVKGSLNNPDKYKNLYVKQSEGLTLNCYDKTTEIVDKSHKYFQTSSFEWEDDGLLGYVEEDKLYRNEIRLNRRNIDKYCELEGLNNEEFFLNLQSDSGRDFIFEYFTRRMIRWNRLGVSYDILSLVQDGKYAHKMKSA